MQKEKNENEKKPYEKPVLRKITLNAEEVLSTGCKLTTGGLSFLPPGCNLTGCHQAGS